MTRPQQEEEKLFLPDPEPEPVAIKLRAVCGFLIGLLAATVLWLQWRDLGLVWTLLLFTVVPVCFAYAAARWGDELWRGLKDEL